MKKKKRKRKTERKNVCPGFILGNTQFPEHHWGKPWKPQHARYGHGVP